MKLQCLVSHVLLVDPNLIPDFFLDAAPETISAHVKESGSTPRWDVKEEAGGDSAELKQTFATLGAMLSPDIVQSIGAVYAFDLKGSCLW